MQGIEIRGHVDTFLVAPDGREEPVACGSNTVSYACADAAAGLFAGRDRAPKTLGFVYSVSTGKMGSFLFNVGDREKVTEDDVISKPTLSVLDVPIDPNPVVSSSDPEKYAGNVTTFRATTGASGKVYIYGYILKDADNRVLAVRKLSSAVEKPANYAIAVAWAITFL